MTRLHFAGIGGSGMMPLALLAQASGHDVSGSDRAFDRDASDARAIALSAAGVMILPQNGSRPDDATLVISSAIEADNPDLAGKGARMHRSELLARLIEDRRAILVGGSSGKTTTTAMIGWILARAGLDPFIYVGGSVGGLAPWGARFGRGPVVVEVDESDGSIARFTPDVAILTSVTEDHKPLAEIEKLFREFIGKSRVAYVSEQARALGGEVVAAGPRLSPLIGEFNRANEALAVAAATTAGVEREKAEELLGDFPGVGRRLQVVYRDEKRIVVDDFAHNPEKIAASISALKALRLPMTVIFQPHGYGPARMHRAGYAKVFSDYLGADDRCLLLPIYDAGGTADRTITSADIANEMTCSAAAVTRSEAASRAQTFLQEGGVVVVMGARDNTLSTFATQLIQK